jgi:hypothetical protein
MVVSQADTEKQAIGATNARNLNICIFFSFYYNFEPLGGYRISSPRKYFLIAQLFSTRRTHFGRSETIEKWTTRREEIYRKDHFAYFIWFGSFGAHRTIEQSETLFYCVFILDSSDSFQQLKVYRNFDYSTTAGPSEKYFRLLDMISISRSWSKYWVLDGTHLSTAIISIVYCNFDC